MTGPLRIPPDANRRRVRCQEPHAALPLWFHPTHLQQNTESRNPMKSLLRKLLSHAALASLLTSAAGAADYHVDARGGDDARDGATPKTAWRTLGKATQSVAAGDHVTVHPGVYFEHVVLNKAGTADRPIRFSADATQRNRVIITGAARELREGKAEWKVEDEKLGLYSTPLANPPARVVADETDLFPYPDPASLKTFLLKPGVEDSAASVEVPGPSHGFAHADGRLFVRLEASGKYGPADPRKRTIQAGPPGGSGGASRNISAPHHTNFAIRTGKPAHVILEGFTFETPGVAAVLCGGDQITVRDCWFRGCRSAVAGARDGISDVLVERCEYSQYPAFDDAMDVLARMPAPPRGRLPESWWQHRGANAQNYRLGFVLRAGNRWVLRQNHIHDCFDALSNWSTGTSRDLEVVQNRFERILGSAVATGSGAAGLKVHHNLLQDVREAFAFNPSEADARPGPVFIHHNVLTTTEAGRKMWRDGGEGAAILRIKAPTPRAGGEFEPVGPAGEGFLVYHNTFFLPGGLVFRPAQMTDREPKNFRFFNNIIVTADSVPRAYRRKIDFSGCEFAGNLLAPGESGDDGPDESYAGRDGQSLTRFEDVKLSEAANGSFTPAAGSPAIGSAVKIASVPDTGADVGAFAAGADGRFAPAGPKVAAPAPAAR